MSFEEITSCSRLTLSERLRFRYWLLTGHVLSASQAYHAGLVFLALKPCYETDIWIEIPPGVDNVVRVTDRD
jgi:hypothetical protein